MINQEKESVNRWFDIDTVMKDNTVRTKDRENLASSKKGSLIRIARAYKSKKRSKQNHKTILILNGRLFCISMVII